MRVFGLLLCAMLLGACSHRTTLERPDSEGGQVIYRLSEEQAFRIARDAFADLLPNRKLFDVTGAQRGYWTTYRFGLDRYSQRVLVIPGVGTDAGGNEVHGYWFDVSGSGSAPITGGAKNRALFRHIRDAADATGSATVVTGLRQGRYETDGHVWLAGGRPASRVVSAPIASAGAPEKLRQLKTMRDEGLLSDDEYEAKRRQVLERL
jgi:hypothetical protein